MNATEAVTDDCAYAARERTSSAHPGHVLDELVRGRAARVESGRDMKLDKEDHRSLVLWAADCAEHVLAYFEEKYPKDD